MTKEIDEIKALFAAPEPADEDTGEEVIKEVVEDEIEDSLDEDVEEISEEVAESDEIKDDEPYSMESLAKAIEVDQRELYEVIVPLRDGTKISISEMKNKYQDMVTDHKKMETTISEQKSVIEKGGNSQASQLSQAEFQAQVSIAQVQEEFNAVNWSEEESYDPSAAVLRRQKLNDRYQLAVQTLGQAQQIRANEHQTVLNDGYKVLLERIPEWQDAEIQKTEKALINQAMLDVGYSQDIINATTDPIAFQLVRELIQLRSEKAKGIDAVKMVKSAPKALRSKGTPKPEKTNLEALTAKAKKTRNKHDEFAAVKALMKSKR